MRMWILGSAIGIWLAIPSTAASQPAASLEWQRVDSLRPGTRIVVTLDTDERHTGRFRRSTNEDLTIDVGKNSIDVKEETFAKIRVRRVLKDDPVKDGIQWGAAVGGGGALALLQVSSSACGIGCENDMPEFAPFAIAAFWGGIGSAVGYLFDRFDDQSELLFPAPTEPPRSSRAGANKFFPARPTVRLGTFYSQATFRSAAIKGSAPAPGFAIAGQIAPYVSLHAEYSAMRATLHPPAGSVPDTVLRNVISSAARDAGWDRGIESRRVSFEFSELFGVHPPPWGRIRVEVLGGVTMRGQEDRDYYDAYLEFGKGTPGDPVRHEAVPGKYYVLNFESPSAGLVYGVDTEIAAARGLLIVPTFRYTTHTRTPGPSLTWGAGVHWRF